MSRFFRLPGLPVNSVALWPSRAEALACARGDVVLGLCAGCGAISNVAFDPTLVGYDSRYDNSLHYSGAFLSYVQELARGLSDRFGLRGKDIVDIGCGNGEFLALLCEQGSNRGVGFDPSFIPGRADLTAGRGVTIVGDYYSVQHASYRADLVVCRHVLEHIPDPRGFLRNVRVAVADRPDAGIYCEVPNAGFVFGGNGLWDVIYEHCLYYTADALDQLFASCGFDVVNVTEGFSGQYLCLEARRATGDAGRRKNHDSEPGAILHRFSEATESHRSTLARWDERLRRFEREGKRVAVWGAGAKGAIFVNAVSAARTLEYIVDVNRHKHGLYVPGTGQQVVGPEFLAEYRPDVLVIVNANYREEIVRQTAAIGIAPDVLTI